MKDIITLVIDTVSTMSLADIVDIAVVAFLIYKTIWFIRKTNSYNLAKGLFVLLAAFFISEVIHLNMISYVLRKGFELGFIAVLILFQPELRKALERMGSGVFSNKSSQYNGDLDAAIAQTVLACSDMSASRTGALIIFERNVKLNDIMGTGTIINADTTTELLKNVFFNKAPLHDGALIIRDGRIAAAGCVLPLTKSTNLSKELGMRHRAGLGLSEQSDAAVIIVSEETGSISVAFEGTLKRHLTANALNQLLRQTLMAETDENESRKGIWNSIKGFFRSRNDEKVNNDEKAN